MRMQAFCPHNGANLAVGGIVKGNCLECPFHGWTFDGKGTCVSVPYRYSPLCPRSIGCVDFPASRRC
jgi:cholesterol 7-dehydrogenase